jgi:lipid-A-disaccharide synthase
VGAAGDPRIAFAAGESSGDLLAALVLPQLRRQLPAAECAGIGGDRMIAAGFTAWWHVRQLSVRGYAEVLRHLPRILALRRGLVRRVTRWPARVFVGVDSADFNLGVEAAVRDNGVRTVHFVGPALWAWRPQRIASVRRAVDHMLLVFPFEPPLYEAAGVRATYVGHPLASAIAMQPNPDAARERLGLRSGVALVAVLPGSRLGEVTGLGPPFFDAVARLQAGDRSLLAVIPAADASLRALIARQLESTPAVDHTRVLLTEGHSHDALEAADAVLVASGTATLEAMLFKKPMVIAYRAPVLTEWITLRRAIVPYIGLPNVLAGRYCVPELLQEAVTGAALARTVLAQLEDAHGQRRLVELFCAQHEALRRPTATLVAQAIAEAAETPR